MNWKRFRYFLLCILSLVATALMAFAPGETLRALDVPVLEMVILVVIVMGLAYLMGRESDREDETAGIISLDDDD